VQLLGRHQGTYRNDRVRRIDAGGTISTVLGDGTAASSGQGKPARAFPVDTPVGIACDAFGNVPVPRVVTTCLTGVAIGDTYTVQIVDSSTGHLVQLQRQPAR
jgi:hypothetical protein